MATKSHPDWAVLEKIGESALIAEGVTAHCIKSWRYRGVPWNMRGRIALLAKSLRVRVPSDFSVRKPAAPEKFPRPKRRRPAEPASRAA
jgi:hypothetical protein